MTALAEDDGGRLFRFSGSFVVTSPAPVAARGTSASMLRSGAMRRRRGLRRMLYAP